MTTRRELWLSVGLCGLVALSWWQLLSAVFDAWHVHAALGASSWAMASIFANHVPELLLITVAVAVWMPYFCQMHETPLRIAVWLLALCGFAMATVGVGALVVRNMSSALANTILEPDTVRSIAGEQVFIAIAVLIAADLTARGMQRATAADRQSVEVET